MALHVLEERRILRSCDSQGQDHGSRSSLLHSPWKQGGTQQGMLSLDPSVKAGDPGDPSSCTMATWLSFLSEVGKR